MPGVERAADPTSCGHSNTGSPNVTANGKGVSRVAADTGGGMIIGPGAQTVFVNGTRVSLPGDSIVAHSCCGSPGCSPHCHATTTSPSTNVIAGTGFMSGGGPEIEPNLTADVPSQFWSMEFIASGIGHYPPTEAELEDAWENCCMANPPVEDPTCLNMPLDLEVPPPIVIGYTVTNEGNHTSQDFVVGLYELSANTPHVIVQDPENPQNSFGPPEVVLRQEQHVDPLAVGQTYNGSFTLPTLEAEGGLFNPNNPLLEPPAGSYIFQVYPDIYMNTTEPNEDNSPANITVLTIPATCAPPPP